MNFDFVEYSDPQCNNTHRHRSESKCYNILTSELALEELIILPYVRNYFITFPLLIILPEL